MNKKTKKFSFWASLTMFFLLIIHVINKVIFFLSTLKEHLYRDHSHYFSWRFGKISYIKIGSGSPVLLIHDLASTGSSYEFKELQNELATSHTVYSLDLIGCGRSEKPKMTYTNYLYVQLISDFIKQVIKEKATVISSRNSCAISIMASYIEPQLVNKLILINPVELKILNQYPKRIHKLLSGILNIPIIGTFIYNINNSKARISKQFNNDYLYTAHPVRRYKDTFSEAAHTSGSASKYVYSSILCHYTNTNIIHALKDMPTPISIIAGNEVEKGDTIISEYQSYQPDITVHHILETKGMPHIENPKQCASCIAQTIK